MRISVGLCLAGALLLAGCGTQPADRALSGAAIGAGVGATTGAATSPSNVDLGKPVWR
jgi:hypothetical protein